MARPGEGTFPEPSPSPVPGCGASTTPRSNGCCTRRTSFPARRSCSTASADDVSAVKSRLTALGHTGVRLYEARLGGVVGRRGPAGRAAPAATTGSCTPTGLRSCSPAAGRRQRRPGTFLLFHVNFGVPEEYEEDHLPGALYLDTNQLENPVDWNRRTPEELDAAAALARNHLTTRPSSSTAATPKAMPTRSGRDAGPGRSPPRARR